MSTEQFNSLLRTLLKVAGTALATHGMVKASSIVNSEDVIGAALLLGGVLWSHLKHGEPPEPPAEPKK